MIDEQKTVSETFKGNYLQALTELMPETLHVSADIQAERAEIGKRYNYSPQGVGQWFNNMYYTADVPLYEFDGETAVHFFGGRYALLKLYVPNITAVYNQIVGGANKAYVLPPEDAQWVRGKGVNSKALKHFDLNDLIEINENDELGYYIINPAKPDKLTPERKAHAQLIHGKDDAFYATMEMLDRHFIFETKVYLPVPKQVKKLCMADGQLVGLGAAIGSLSGKSSFYGGVPDILNYDGTFLGVRRR